MWIARDGWSNSDAVIVGAVLLALGLLAVATTALFARRRKQLDYRVLSSGRLFPVAPIPAPLRIQVHDQIVAEPYLCTVRLSNTGKIAVARSDYEQEISITNVGMNQVVVIPVTASRDALLRLSNLGARTLLNPFLLSPTLLNPRDFIDFVVITDGPPGDLNVTSVFAGQTKPMVRLLDTSQRRAAWVFGALVSVIGATSTLLVLTFYHKRY